MILFWSNCTSERTRTGWDWQRKKSAHKRAVVQSSSIIRRVKAGFFVKLVHVSHINRNACSNPCLLCSLRLVPQWVLRFVHIVDAWTFWRHQRVVTNCRMCRWLTCLRIHSCFFKLLTTSLDRRMVRLVDLRALG